MALFIWIISDTIVEYGVAIGFAPTKAEAIDAICNGYEDEEFAKELRAELENSEPRIETSNYGYFFASPT